MCTDDLFNRGRKIRDQRTRDRCGLFRVRLPGIFSVPVFTAAADHAKIMAQGSLDQVFFTDADLPAFQKMAEPYTYNAYVECMVGYRSVQVVCFRGSLPENIRIQDDLPIPEDLPADRVFLRDFRSVHTDSYLVFRIDIQYYNLTVLVKQLVVKLYFHMYLKENGHG